MSREDCESVNWFEKGKEDIKDGKTRGIVYKHQKSCDKYGVTVDMKRYNDGWSQAAEKYCTPDNGLTVGRSGRQYYRGTCPADLEQGFFERYAIGRKIYVISKDIRILDRNIEVNRKNWNKVSLLERQKKIKQKDLKKLEAQVEVN